MKQYAKLLLQSKYRTYRIFKGAKLVGAVGALAPTLFLPRPEFAPIWVKKVGFQGPNPPRNLEISMIYDK